MKRVFFFLIIAFSQLGAAVENDGYAQIPFGCPEGYRQFYPVAVIRLGNTGSPFPLEPRTETLARAQRMLNLLNSTLASQIIQALSTERDSCRLRTQDQGIFKIDSQVVLSTGAVQPIIRFANTRAESACRVTLSPRGNYLNCAQIGRADAACCVPNNLVPGLPFPQPLPNLDVSTDPGGDVFSIDGTTIQVENYDNLVSLEEASQDLTSDWQPSDAATVEGALNALPILQQLSIADSLYSF